MNQIDLGKLIKMADDAHKGFVDQLPVKKLGTPGAYRESRMYKQLIARHRAAVEGKVSFNPLELLRIRLQANRYLRRYGKYRP